MGCTKLHILDKLYKTSELRVSHINKRLTLDNSIKNARSSLLFGEVFIEERNNTWNTPYLFNAKELDAETGLYYVHARYYDPRISLWLSADPLQEKYPNISTYAYCIQNPVKFIDPDGLDWYQHAKSGGTFWQEGSAGYIDRDGLRYENIGATYRYFTDDNVAIMYHQNEVMNVYYHDQDYVSGEYNISQSTREPSFWEKWRDNAPITYSIINDAYVTLQPFTFELFTEGGRINEFTGGHAFVNLDGSTNYKGIDSATRTFALIFTSFGGSAAPAASGTNQSLVQANRAAGNAFRDELAAALRAEGRVVIPEVYKPTPIGKRYMDLDVWLNGKNLGGIETKVGGSRYHTLQRFKDLYLEKVKGYPVNVVRKPKNW